MTFSLRFRAAVVSIALLAAFLGIWHLATRGTGAVATMSPEYAKLMGLTATQGKSVMPGPLDVGAKLWEHLKRPFYDNGPNDKGLGIQLGYSVARVGLGYLLAVIVAIPLGFLIGMSPLINRALDPFMTILTGMRISIGIAWLVIVAAEMLVGGTGIGYFVWNEWNNLSITNVIIAILLIGVVGMLLDQVLARFTRMVTFPE